MPVPSETLYPGAPLYPGEIIEEEVFRATSRYQDPLAGDVDYQK